MQINSHRDVILLPLEWSLKLVPVPAATAPGAAEESILWEKLCSGEGPGVDQANNVEGSCPNCTVRCMKSTYVCLVVWPLLPTHRRCRGYCCIWAHTHTHGTSIHAPGGIRTRNPSNRAVAHLRLDILPPWRRSTSPANELSVEVPLSALTSERVQPFS
jgi:hypothetical protein